MNRLWVGIGSVLALIAIGVKMAAHDHAGVPHVSIRRQPSRECAVVITREPAQGDFLVLAAGSSERMGDFKPLMTLGGMTILERVVRLFQSAGIRRIHVVVGHRASELAPVIERLGARALVNARYHEGMFSSVCAGVAGLDGSTEAFFSLPVDIPLVRTTTLNELMRASPAGGSAICHPTFGKRRGHPPLIGCRHIQPILDFSGAGGSGCGFR